MLSYKEYKKLTPHDPTVICDRCVTNFALGYYPKEELKKILPKKMSIPSDDVMAKAYPTANPMNGMQPFLMIFSECWDVYNVYTESKLRPYKEIYCYFPVIYTNNGEEHLCSYLPVLYLDYFLGVIGGFYFGMRKQFHPTMKYDQTDTSNSYFVKDILDASFDKTSTESTRELDPFFEQIFKKPMLTISYFNRTNFFSAFVKPTKVIDTSVTYNWNYKGSVITNNENTFSCYCEMNWKLSPALGYEKYFHPTYPVKARA